MWENEDEINKGKIGKNEEEYGYKDEKDKHESKV